MVWGSSPLRDLIFRNLDVFPILGKYRQKLGIIKSGAKKSNILCGVEREKGGGAEFIIHSGTEE